MIVETHAAIPAAPGRKARHDYEYERNGVANLFMMFAPLEGWRCVKVTDRHAAIDYAHALKDLFDAHFPGAAKIVLVQDDLSTHTPASLYAAFPAAEARRLSERFEWHYRQSAAVGSTWRIELGVLATQCLNRRIPDNTTLIEEVAAWRGQSQQASRQGRLAIQNRRRSRQAKTPIPSVRMIRTLASPRLTAPCGNQARHVAAHAISLVDFDNHLPAFRLAQVVPRRGLLGARRGEALTATAGCWLLISRTSAAARLASAARKQKITLITRANRWGRTRISSD